MAAPQRVPSRHGRQVASAALKPRLEPGAIVPGRPHGGGGGGVPCRGGVLERETLGLHRYENEGE